MEPFRRTFSPIEIDSAGRILARDPNLGEPDEEWLNAVRLVNVWRSSHDRPLNTFQVNLRRRVGQRDIVARRLKRLPSVTAKLVRLPRIRLSQMQDIGGCRAVVATSDRAFSIASSLVDSRIRHELVRYNDYITDPRQTGYRSIHLVYAYYSERMTDLQGLNVEVQIRSRLQHQWATAVETVGTFIGDDLKSNIGDPTWLRFFALMSTVIAHQEGTPDVPNTPLNYGQLVKEIKECDRLLGVSERLNAFRQVARRLHSLRGIRNHWVVLELNLETGRFTGYAFRPKDLPDATSLYLDKELESRRNPLVDVVLVSASSLSALRRAYPNYFVDLTHFRRLFQQTIES